MKQTAAEEALHSAPGPGGPILVAAEEPDDGGKGNEAAILERGVEVNAAAADGTTALHLAAAAGFRESCRVLLQHGADRGQKNAAGATAIDAAKGGGHDQLAAFIDGWTPAALGENTRATDPEL
jgi:hypothetical protein